MMADAKAARERVSATSELADLADCDLVLESIVEDLAVKKQLFAELDKIVKPSAILATNTSTLPVVDMAVATSRPGHVVGIHFFNPAPMMGLVEVVRAITSSDDTVEAALAFAKACGKDPIEVRDVAGFVAAVFVRHDGSGRVQHARDERRRDRHGRGSEVDVAELKSGEVEIGIERLRDKHFLSGSIRILIVLEADGVRQYLVGHEVAVVAEAGRANEHDRVEGESVAVHETSLPVTAASIQVCVRRKIGW